MGYQEDLDAARLADYQDALKKAQAVDAGKAHPSVLAPFQQFGTGVKVGFESGSSQMLQGWQNAADAMNKFIPHAGPSGGLGKAAAALTPSDQDIAASQSIPGKVGQFVGGMVPAAVKFAGKGIAALTSVGENLPLIEGPDKDWAGFAKHVGGDVALSALPKITSRMGRPQAALTNATAGFGYGKLQGQSNEEAASTGGVMAGFGFLTHVNRPQAEAPWVRPSAQVGAEQGATAEPPLSQSLSQLARGETPTQTSMGDIANVTGAAASNAASAVGGAPQGDAMRYLDQRQVPRTTKITPAMPEPTAGPIDVLANKYVGEQNKRAAIANLDKEMDKHIAAGDYAAARDVMAQRDEMLQRPDEAWQAGGPSEAAAQEVSRGVTWDKIANLGGLVQRSNAIDKLNRRVIKPEAVTPAPQAIEPRVDEITGQVTKTPIAITPISGPYAWDLGPLKYVSSKPITLTPDNNFQPSGKIGPYGSAPFMDFSARRTARDIAWARSGEQLAQDARGQVALAPLMKYSPVDREMATWARLADPEVTDQTQRVALTQQKLQAWADNTDSKFAAMLDKASPTGSGLSFRKQIQMAANDPARALAIADQATPLLNEIGRASVNTGIFDGMRQNYLPGLYVKDDANPNLPTIGGTKDQPVLRANDLHAEHKQFPTLYQAISEGGLTPVTTDIAALADLRNRAFAKVFANWKLKNALLQNGLAVNSADAPAGYANVNVWDGDKRGSNIAIPNNLAKHMSATLDQAHMPWWADMAQAANSATKYVNLSLSLFHHKNLGLKYMAQSGNGLDLLRLPDAVQKLGGEDAVAVDAAQHGLVANSVDAAKEALTNRNNSQILSTIVNTPGIKQLGQVADANNRLLFNQMLPAMKRNDYAMKVYRWQQDNPNAAPEQVTAAKRGIVKQINAAYGGLNWEALGVSPTALAVARMAMLAPDWTASNFVGLKYATEKGVAGNAARASLLSGLTQAAIATEALNYAATGHFTDENDRGHELEIQTPNGTYVNLFPAEVQDALKFYYRNPGQFAQNKESPLARAGNVLIGGKDRFGKNYAQPGSGTAGWLTKTVPAALYNAAPVPFGLSAFSQMAFKEHLNPVEDPTTLFDYGLATSGLGTHPKKAGQ